MTGPERDLEALLTLPAEQATVLVGLLAAGFLPWPPDAQALDRYLGPRAAPVARALASLAARGESARAAAWWLDVLLRRATAPFPVELVWSRPVVPHLPGRTTARTVADLIAHARRSVWLSTFVYFDGPRAFGPLAGRLDATPELRATLLLNIGRRWGDRREASAIVRAFAERFWGEDWPGERRPRVYYDPRALEPDGPGGVLHAKALVVDEQALLVTSANLTEAAYERNIELGLLVRDRYLATTAVRQLQALIDTGYLKPLPGP